MVLKGKFRPYGKILLIIASILPFSNTFVSFSISTVLSAKYEVRLVHFIFHLLSCFLLLTLCIFPQRSSERDGSVTA